MIVNSTFNIGGYSSNDLTAGVMLGKEQTKTWGGYVGIMTASDYGYASDLTVCTQTLGNYNNENCKGTNYLQEKGFYEWLLTYNPDSNSYSFLRSTDGYISPQYSSNCYAKGVRPVVYLNSNVKIIGDGDGSSGNPFELSL